MCVGIRFTSAAGEMYFGRNYDWNMSYGERPLATPAGHETAWRFLPTSASAYRIIGMGITMGGMPMYFDAANEAGLAIAGLSFPETSRFPAEAVAGKRNVALFELPLWVTSTFGSVTELEAALADTAIIGVPAYQGGQVAPLHWIVADATGSIVIESTERGLEVFHDDVDVLTNEPDFRWQRTNLRNYLGAVSSKPTATSWNGAELAPMGHGGGMFGIPGDYSPASRFVKAAYVNTHYPAQEGEAANVARMFRTLGSVFVPKGCVGMANGTWDATLYQGMYSAATRTYYYSTYDDPAIRAVALDEVDFAGSADVVAL